MYARTEEIEQEERRVRFSIIPFSGCGKQIYVIFDHKINNYAEDQFYLNEPSARNTLNYLVESCGRWY